MDILVLPLESFIGLFKSDGSKNSSFSAQFVLREAYCFYAWEGIGFGVFICL